VYQLRDLVLFVYSVQHGLKFHGLLDFVHSTPDTYTVPEFCPSQLGHSIVGVKVTSMRHAVRSCSYC